MASTLPSASALSFEAVLAKYAAAHNEHGTDKTTSHAYGPLYSALFEPYRETARAVMEIGVYSGASVLAMAEFFEGAAVTGVDITLDNVRFGRFHPRVTFRKMDGTRPEAPALLLGGAAAAAGRWDVVLDDASHRPEDQVQACRVWGPHVAPGGIFVIEDIDGGRGDEVRAGLEAAAAELGTFGPVEWHDLRGVKGQFDDIVAVLRRRPA